MMKRVSLLLPVLAVLLFMEIKGNPLIEVDGGVDPKDRESSRILPKADWLNFHNTWSLPSLPSVASLFGNEDKSKKEAGTMKTRIEALEQSQKDIIKMLKKMTQDIKSNSSPCENKPPEVVLPVNHKEEPILPSKPEDNEKNKAKVTVKPVTIENPATHEPTSPESPMDHKNPSIQDKMTSVSKLENVTLEDNEEKLNSELEDKNEDVALQGSVLQATQMNDRIMPFIDDVN